MKNKTLTIRVSDKRLQKLKEIAASREKTMTQMIEDWIDRLVPNID
jgi:predicted transcriptional regulator